MGIKGVRRCHRRQLVTARSRGRGVAPSIEDHRRRCYCMGSTLKAVQPSGSWCTTSEVVDAHAEGKGDGGSEAAQVHLVKQRQLAHHVLVHWLADAVVLAALCRIATRTPVIGSHLSIFLSIFPLLSRGWAQLYGGQMPRVSAANACAHDPSN
eukprot:1189226-Prorocentrum_minimum.AAC.2